MSEQTHWKKLTNPDYLGAYALEPGQDITATIKSVKVENIIGADGKKEDCTVMRFVEAVKPMILNVTNAKTLEKLFKTPYIEEWSGKKIQIGVESVKAFGDVVDALRIRKITPKAPQPIPPCTDCKGEIKPAMGKTAAYMAEYTTKNYSVPLCAECAGKRKAAKEAAETKEETVDVNTETDRTIN